MGVVMEKNKGIGGTDISAILGMNPYKTPLDVWLDKTGQAEPKPDTEEMWWGREMEPVLAKRYEKETGTTLVIPHKSYLVLDKPWYRITPDALVNPIMIPQSEGGVDFKTSGKPHDWGEPGTDEIPKHYHLQADWYMGGTGAQWWDVAVLLMSFKRQFMIFRVTRDDELIGYLQEEAERFWNDHVLANKPPAIDGSTSATEYVKKKYPFDSGPMLEPTDPEILLTLTRYRELRETIKAYNLTEQELENYLKDYVGTCMGMEGGWGKITWKRSKDSQTTDWKSAFEEWAELDPTLSEIIKQKHIIIKPGARRWLPRFAKED